MPEPPAPPDPRPQGAPPPGVDSCGRLHPRGPREGRVWGGSSGVARRVPGGRTGPPGLSGAGRPLARCPLLPVGLRPTPTACSARLPRPEAHKARPAGRGVPPARGRDSLGALGGRGGRIEGRARQDRRPPSPLLQVAEGVTGRLPASASCLLAAGHGPALGRPGLRTWAAGVVAAAVPPSLGVAARDAGGDVSTGTRRAGTQGAPAGPGPRSGLALPPPCASLLPSPPPRPGDLLASPPPGCQLEDRPRGASFVCT